MEVLFQKLPLLLDLDISVGDIKGDLINDYGTLKNFRFKDPDEINQILSNKISFEIPAKEFHLVEITGGVAVHTDGVTTGLTYYLTSDGSITRFWRPDESRSLPVPYIDPEGNVKYNETKTWRAEDLSLLASFKAQAGDCYLLNAQHPHSVDFPETNQSRYLLKWHWDEDFDTVLGSIRIL